MSSPITTTTKHFWESLAGVSWGLKNKSNQLELTWYSLDISILPAPAASGLSNMLASNTPAFYSGYIHFWLTFQLLPDISAGDYSFYQGQSQCQI